MDETEANTKQIILLVDFIRLLQANQNGTLCCCFTMISAMVLEFLCLFMAFRGNILSRTYVITDLNH